jgi:aminopeptidase N
VLRSCYDVLYYNLTIKVNVEDKYINGSTVFTVRNILNYNKLQIDLFDILTLDSIVHQGKKLSYVRQGNACFVTFDKAQPANEINTFEVFFRGRPLSAKRPPWDGGFVWRTDSLKNNWVGVACEGLGASSWWACKDYLGDEPDSMQINIIHPKNLIAVANGQMKNITQPPDTAYIKTTFEVKNPINTYNVTLNLANYTLLTDTYTDAQNTPHTLRYYVLTYNAQRAAKHFAQVKTMLQCYEKHFGAYPFYTDGYTLTETSYWGMEHQSCIAYGNNYKNNDFGFDFIIAHESAHEWFGNSLSVADHAEMWIHESLATYAETILVECLQGTQAATQYINTQRPRLQLRQKMVGNQGVNDTNNDVDVYFKGALMLHTLRQVINNDALWFATLKNFTETYRHKFVNTNNLVAFFNHSLGKDYTVFFNEYLYHTALPQLQYKTTQKGKNTLLTYRYAPNQQGFELPLKITINGKNTTINPTERLQTKVIKNTTPKQIIISNDNYLIEITTLP